MLPHVFILHLDKYHRVIKVNACWDNNDADLQHNVRKIKAYLLEMAQTIPGKVLNVGSPIEGIMIWTVKDHTEMGCNCNTYDLNLWTN